MFIVHRDNDRSVTQQKKKKGLKYGACPYHPQPHLASLISFLQNNVAPSPTAD